MISDFYIEVSCDGWKWGGLFGNKKRYCKNKTKVIMYDFFDYKKGEAKRLFREWLTNHHGWVIRGGNHYCKECGPTAIPYNLYKGEAMTYLNADREREGM